MGKSLAELNVILGAKVKGFDTAMKGVAKKLDRLQRDLEKTGKTLTTRLTVPILGMGAAAVKSAADLEVLQNRLLTAFEGSEEMAAKAYASLEKFATDTPYQITELVDAFVKLQNLGLNPSMEALTAYGNTASAMGKSLDQMIEAVADAATGEFERLKEFGIKASKQGDQVTFTFRGVKTTIKNDSKEIEQYLQNIGNVQFAGSMDRQANTLLGIWSTTKDKLNQFLQQIGTEIIKTFDLKTVVKELGESLGRAVEWFKSLDDQTKKNILRITLFAAAIGPAVFIVSKLIGTVSMVATALKTMTKGVVSVIKILPALFSPMGAAVALLAGLAAAITYVVYNWQAIKDRFTDIAWWRNTLIEMIQFFIRNNPFSYIIKAYNYVAEKLGGEAITNPFDEMSKALNVLKVPEKAHADLKSFGATAKEVGKDLMKLVGLDFTPKIAPAVAETASTTTTNTDTADVIDDINASAQDLNNTLKEIEKREVLPLDKIDGGFNNLESKLSSRMDAVKERMGVLVADMQSMAIASQQVLIDISATLAQALENSFSTFASSIGDLMAGAASIGDAAKAMAMPLLSVLDQIGDLAIQTGVAMLAIKKTLSFGNPILAIGAGIALKALASFVKGKLSNVTPRLAKGGLAYGDTLAVVGDNPMASVDPEVISPLSKLKSIMIDSLKSSLPVPSMSPAALSTGGFQIEAGEMRLRGADLYASLQITEKMKGRIY